MWIYGAKYYTKQFLDSKPYNEGKNTKRALSFKLLLRPCYNLQSTANRSSIGEADQHDFENGVFKKDMT